MAIEAIPDFIDPDPALEQYVTPAPLAAELIWSAKMQGWLSGARVIDLGCGTGRLALGAAWLGATVTAIDVDPEVLGVASEADPTAEVTWVTGDLADWEQGYPGVDPPYDLAILNPPWGAQHQGADRPFLAAATTWARRSAILVPQVSARWVRERLKESGQVVRSETERTLRLGHSMPFHTQEHTDLRVLLLLSEHPC